jgi:hypothetical protein
LELKIEGKKGLMAWWGVYVLNRHLERKMGMDVKLCPPVVHGCWNVVTVPYTLLCMLRRRTKAKKPMLELHDLDDYDSEDELLGGNTPS